MKTNFYIALSLLMHLTLLLISLSNKIQSNPAIEKSGKTKVEVSLNYNKEEKIVPISIKGTDKSAKTPDYYYGIGVWAFSDTGGVYRIDNVLGGYPAETLGIKVHDIITLINGNPISYKNDLRTEGSQTLVLTMLRNGVTFNLTIKTDKIFYQ